MITQKYLNDIAYKVVGCAIEVNKHQGPGLLESVYELSLLYELKKAGLKAESQVRVPVFYKGVDLGGHLVIDILVEDEVVVELKTVESILPIHEAQILTYLKLTHNCKGVLINFNSTKIIDTTKHFVTEKFAHLPKE
jgi:GxxExxY protein